MEYASGGELFERICNAGRFSEDEVLIIFNTWILNAVPLLRLTLVTVICAAGTVFLPTTYIRG